MQHKLQTGHKNPHSRKYGQYNTVFFGIQVKFSKISLDYLQIQAKIAQEETPMGYDILFQQALQLHEQGRLNEAENIYRQILETAPDNADVLNLLGLIAQAKGMHSQATELFYHAVKQAPKHAPFWFNLGLSLENDNKPIEALQAYQTALELKPDFKEALSNMGDIYNKEQKSDLADEMYNKALQIDGNYTPALANLAALKQDIQALQTLCLQYPSEAIFPYYLSKIYQNNAQYEQALTYIRQAQTIAPSSLDVLETLAELLMLTNKEEEAIKIFEQILCQNPNSVPALINLANHATQLQDYTKAERYYKQALDLAPHDLDAHFNYANMLYRQNRLPEALEEYRAAVIINPNRYEISNNLGLIQKDLGEYEEALGLFFNSFFKNPTSEDIALNIVETLTLLYHQDQDKAIKIAQNWQDKAPNNIFAQQINAAFNGETSENNQIYIQKLFDHFADNYEMVLRRIGYLTPRKLRDITSDVKGTLVDLGCGTGLVGEAYQTSLTKLIGVDISEKSLTQARNKNIYQELIKDDILHFCQTKLKDYQPSLITAADVFCYFGDLEEILAACAPFPLAFSVEKADDAGTKPFVRQASGRYQHQASYIEQLLKKYGYTNINQYPLVLRKEYGQDVNGIIFTAK